MDCQAYGKRNDCATAEEIKEYFTSPNMIIGLSYGQAQLDMKNQTEPLQYAANFITFSNNSYDDLSLTPN